MHALQSVSSAVHHKSGWIQEMMNVSGLIIAMMQLTYSKCNSNRYTFMIYCIVISGLSLQHPVGK